MWPPMRRDSRANQEWGAVQREGAGLPGQLWRGREKKTAAARDTERDVQEGSYHRSQAADQGYTTPAAQRGPFSRNTTGNPAPGGDRDRKSRPGRPPHPPATPSTHSRMDMVHRLREGSSPSALPKRSSSTLRRESRHMGLSVSHFGSRPRVAGRSLPP